MTTVKFAELVFDFDMYPRQSIDSQHIGRLMDALLVGETLPPIVVDKATKKVIDGFHRARAYSRAYGADVEIPVKFVSFKTHNAMVVEAARLNAAHGKALNSCDRAHFFIIARRCGIKSGEVAWALNMTEKKLEELVGSRLAFRKGAPAKSGPDVALKGTIRHMAGRKLNEEQQKANSRLGGMKQLFFVNQVLLLLKSKLIDKENEGVMEGLVELRMELEAFLGAKK